MSKTSTESVRHALGGATMGTRWSALFYTDPGFDAAPIRSSLRAAVEEVDAQMSTWRPESDLVRFSGAPVGQWMNLPDRLIAVLRLGLGIGRASGGAFDIGLGDAVAAWGFGSAAASPDGIRAAMERRREPAHELLELDPSAGMARKLGPVTLDLNGIAKGYGVDRLAEVLTGFGLKAGLVGIDGEMRALGLRPDGRAWTVAVEAPDPDRRTPHSLLALEDAAVATSGDYRHWVDVGGRRLSHSMDPWRGAPLVSPPASVTVVARTCAEADAWASALMVLGVEDGGRLADRLGLHALFLTRDAESGIRASGRGPLLARTTGSGRGCAPGAARTDAAPGHQVLSPAARRR